MQLRRTRCNAVSASRTAARVVRLTPGARRSGKVDLQSFQDVLRGGEGLVDVLFGGLFA